MAAGLILVLEIARWSSAELFAEHGDEGAGAVVARFERGGGHLFTAGQRLDGVKQAELLTPAGETHVGFFEEQALDGALAGAAFLAMCFQCFLV